MIVPELDKKDRNAAVTPSSTFQESKVQGSSNIGMGRPLQLVSSQSPALLMPMPTGTSTQPPPYEPHHPVAGSSTASLRPRESMFAPSTPGTRAFAPSLSPEPSTVVPPSTSPPSFSRMPSQEAGYPYFSSMYLIAHGKYLSKGFPAIPPPSSVQPHPFITHDVTEEDWTRFITDVNQVAELTERERANARHLPIIGMVPYVNGIISHALRVYMKKRKEIPVSERIYTWNHYFFHPRKLDVVLMRGQERIGRNHPEINDKSIDLVSGQSKDHDEEDKTYRLYIRHIV